MDGVADIQANEVIAILSSLVGSSPFYHSQPGEGYASPYTPTMPSFISSVMSQLPVPWAFFCALYTWDGWMKQHLSRAFSQLSSWDQVTDLRKRTDGIPRRSCLKAWATGLVKFFSSTRTAGENACDVF